MRILIVGAGIAGLTLAAFLKQRGLNPVVIEKCESFGSVGYMLGLWPTSANILRAINCYNQYIDSSNPANLYEAYTENNQLLKKFSLDPIIERYGPYQVITRYELLSVIHQACGELDLRFNTQVVSLSQTDHEVEVLFDNKTQENFDLVVGSDGLHSQIRTLILTDKEYQYFHTGWGGWVWWSHDSMLETNKLREFFGIGTFWGEYPVKGKTGVIAAVDSPTAENALQGKSRKEFIERKFAKLLQHRPDSLNALPPDNDPVFFWSLCDQRTTTWHKGRVVLLGDAATAFLPTAGVGASMALESAAVLNDVLSRTGVEFIPQALSKFENRRKKTIENAQNDSRGLAKIMFVSSPWRARLRNYIYKMMPVKSLIKSIVKGFDNPI